MNTNDLFPPSEYLKSEDIEEVGEMELTISKVDRIEFEDNGKKQVKGKLSFVETDKNLTLNVTNTNTIAGMFGKKDIDTVWVGKKIILWVDPNIQFAGDIVKGIRVRMIDKKQQIVTAYWSKSKELGFDREEGLKHLAQFGNDFEAALLALTAPAGPVEPDFMKD